MISKYSLVMESGPAGYGLICWRTWKTFWAASIRLRRRRRSTSPGIACITLKGELRGFWSVTVRANWRIIFRFEREDAFEVELLDYR